MSGAVSNPRVLLNASVWYSASGAPASGLGSNGDYYLNTETGDVYTKTDNSWGSPIANITGPTPGVGLKAGSIPADAFVDGVYTVTFINPYSDNTYVITGIIGMDARLWSIDSKNEEGFVIDANSSTDLTGPVFWTTNLAGEV